MIAEKWELLSVSYRRTVRPWWQPVTLVQQQWCHLLDGKTGKRLATVSAPNAQRSFDADVISRIQAAEGDGLELLHGAIRDQISHMLEQLLERAGTKRSGQLGKAVAGNTVMSLFTDLSPKSIGVVPFTLGSLFGDMYKGASLGLELCEQVILYLRLPDMWRDTQTLICRKMHSAQLAAKYSGKAITADQTEEKYNRQMLKQKQHGKCCRTKKGKPVSKRK